LSYLYSRFRATPAFTKKTIEEFCEHRHEGTATAASAVLET
jgi:hypothetical protein